MPRRDQVDSRVERIRHPHQAGIVSVVAVHDLAPGYRRITFEGPHLSSLVSPSPRDNIRLVLPLDPAAEPVLPPGNGKGAWLTDSPHHIVRTFTLRRARPEAARVEIDVILHASGPATAWARQAQPGQQVGLVGPRGSKIVHPAFDWFLMIGDETMLPSIMRSLDDVPAGVTTIAIVEVQGPENELPVASNGDAQVQWVYRGDAAPGTGTALLDATRATSLPRGEGYVFGGGEAGQLAPIRRHLLDDRGIPKANMSISGHWKLGVANHDHHEPIDPAERR